MTVTTASTAPGRWRTRLLAAILVTLTCFPILIFATNATQRGPLMTARKAALARARVQEIPDSVRRARQTMQRRQIRPTFKTAMMGLSVQLFWIAMIAVVGRRWFKLRL